MAVDRCVDRTRNDLLQRPIDAMGEDVELVVDGLQSTQVAFPLLMPVKPGVLWAVGQDGRAVERV